MNQKVRSFAGAHIALFQVRFVDYGLGNAWIFKYMLAEVGVHFEYVVGGLGLRDSIRTALGSAIALLAYCFWHFGVLVAFNTIVRNTY